MTEITITALKDLNPRDLRPLLDESLAEGYRFVQTLWDEYESGKNRFDAPGAVLLGAFEGERLIGVGGVQPDPYLKLTEAGRIRHVYVLHAYRRQGVGKRLLDPLIEHAQDHFEVLTLRTNTPSAARFMRRLALITPQSTQKRPTFYALFDTKP